MPRSFVTACLAIAAALPASAVVGQETVGRVLESGTEMGVRGATVVLMDWEGNRIQGAFTDADGVFGWS